MLKKRKKQLLIAFIYFLLFIGLLFLVYVLLIKPSPSCKDGVKNQGEEKVDCGGPCAPCEQKEAKKINVLWLKTLPVTDSSANKFYDLIAKVKNPNLNYSSSEVPYKFEIYNLEGEIIKAYDRSTYILSNQIKYLIIPRVKLDNLNDLSVKISFGDINWKQLKKQTVSLSDLVIQDKEYSLLENPNETGYSQLRATLINKTNYDFSKVEIKVLAFNSFKELISVRKTEIDSLSSNEKREFIVTWFNKIDGEVTSLEIEPETNLLDSDNYISNIPKEIEEFQRY